MVKKLNKFENPLKTGAEQMQEYLPLLKGKQIALVANHSSLIGKTHLIDTLLASGIHIVKVFGPEHGFRGEADAGEHVESGKDSKTGIPLISLHGDHKKPLPDQLQGVDLVLFDIQDVGVRFYTYISTMTYVMEACAEMNVPFVVLDRPNPNGYYVDGPVLKPGYVSFLGLHPVPLVHGMTVGEYARMVNGEGWLKDSIKCNLKVIGCKGWRHGDYYQIPTNPSPNLRSMNAIYLYPSLGLFEGTRVSLGRGTSTPFEKIGYPGYKNGKIVFTPESGKVSKHPLFEGKVCNGLDLKGIGQGWLRDSKKINLSWLIDLYQQNHDKQNFFTPYFDKHAGSDELRKQIMAGESEQKIRESWQSDINKYLIIRKKYLLYPE